MATYQSAAVVAGIMPDGARAGVPLNRSEKYTASSALAAGSVVEMVPIPKGAKVIGLDLAWSAFGLARTLDVGIGGEADKFFDGLNVEAAGNATLFVDGEPDSAGYTFTENDTIDVTVLGDTWPADAWVFLTVTYKMTGTIADET